MVPQPDALITMASSPSPAISADHAATLARTLNLSGNHLKIAKKAFVLATGYTPSPFTRFADEARALGWPVEALATHHFTMLSMPRETADVLMRHAA